MTDDRTTSDDLRTIKRLIGVALAVAIGIGAVFYWQATETTNDLSRLVAENEKTIEVNRKQAVGANVANCAYQNIARLSVTDAFTILEKAHAFRAAAEVDAALDEVRTALQPVDCKVLAPERDRLNIELNYPTTIPPPQ